MISALQLRELGVSASGVKRRVARAWLHRQHRGVYSVGIARLTPRGRLMAAVLACGPRAALSHRSAAALYEIHRYGGLPEVTVPGTGSHRRKGIWVHASTTLRPEHVTHVHGIRCTTPQRTLADLRRTLRSQQHDQATARAARAQLIDLPQGPPLLRSETERRFRNWLTSLGLPKFEANFELGPWELDFYWPHHRVALELDTYATHGDPVAFDRDRRKDAWLAARGVRVIRATPTQPRGELEHHLKSLLALASSSAGEARRDDERSEAR